MYKGLCTMKRDYVQEGTIYRGLEGLQVSLRWLYIIVVIDCEYDSWKIMMIKFSIGQSIFVLENFLLMREKVQNQKYPRGPFSNCSNL